MALININLHNTLTGKKEALKPIHDMQVGIYTCGPTVYNYAHIGNLRAYVTWDVLRRALEYNGYRVKQVMNITDIGHLTSDTDDGDDKMVKALKREAKPLTLEGLREVAERYTRAFVEDLRTLNCKIPESMPRASEHIREDVELIALLEKNGIAYRTREGIYFDVSKFPGYGKLGNINLAGLRAGARILPGDKKGPHDFALWKFSNTDIGWSSPWGKGFPGWHIECSAMSRSYLGQPFDIHTGGIDHIPTHHQNEIAQSETAYDAPLANYWLHNEHLIVPTGKMAKSGENFITLRTLTDRGFHPLAYRYYLLGAHYRTPMNWSFEALEAAERSYYKLLTAFLALGTKSDVLPENRRESFLAYINDDLNTPGALSLLWEILKDSQEKAETRRALVQDFDEVLGLDIEEQAGQLQREILSVPDEVKNLASAREEARQAKDFAKADLIREEIHSAGFDIMDTDTGPLIRKSLKH